MFAFACQTAAAFQQGKIPPTPFPGGPPPPGKKTLTFLAFLTFDFKTLYCSVLLYTRLKGNMLTLICVMQVVLLVQACYQRPLWEVLQ